MFGGTFDPVHVAHLVAAMSARHQLGLDRVLLVVARDPWQKHGDVVAPAAARYDMVAAALEGVNGLDASRIEIDRDGPTYTIDTVHDLHAPDREIVLVVGSDVASRLGTWHRVDELRAAVSLAIVAREGEPVVLPDGWRAEAVSMPRLDVSSTDLRRRVAAGEPIDFLVPPAAVQVLRARALYTSS